MEEINHHRIADFYYQYCHTTGCFRDAARIEMLDKRIHQSGLSPAEKIGVLKMLCTRHHLDESGQLRITRLLLSLPPNTNDETSKTSRDMAQISQFLQRHFPLSRYQSQIQRHLLKLGELEGEI